MSNSEDFVANERKERNAQRHSSSKTKDDLSLSEKSNRGDAIGVKKATSILRSNAKYAVAIWGELPKVTLRSLKELAGRHELSIPAGDLQLVNGRWYVTHAGLLRIAQRNRCSGMRTTVDKGLSDPTSSRWVFKAIVYKSPRSRGFVGYGDADPSNVSSLVHGAEMRVAETRAVNRALRKAYGVGTVSAEELGSAPRSYSSGSSAQRKASTNGNNDHHNGQPRLRDRLCLLIREHHLDAGLVKAFAADFCGTPTLRDANRDQVEAFINDLAERATKDRDGLICQLNRRPQSSLISTYINTASASKI
jgi:hypothetical protein